MTNTDSQPAVRSETRALSRRLGVAATVGAIGVLVAVAIHLVWINFGRDDFARTAELGGMFLYWWGFGAVIGVVSFIFALKSTTPTPLLDFLGVFAIASTAGVAVAATDFSAGRYGPMNLTLPLLFTGAWFLIRKLREGGQRRFDAPRGDGS